MGSGERYFLEIFLVWERGTIREYTLLGLEKGKKALFANEGAIKG